MTSLGLIQEALATPCESFSVLSWANRAQCYCSPRTQCFEDGGYKAFTEHTVLQRGFDIGLANASDPFLQERLIRSQREAEALFKTQVTVCKEVMGDQLRYMGTSTVVRDIDFITKELEGEDALM